MSSEEQFRAFMEISGLTPLFLKGMLEQLAKQPWKRMPFPRKSRGLRKHTRRVKAARREAVRLANDDAYAAATACTARSEAK